RGEHANQCRTQALETHGRDPCGRQFATPQVCSDPAAAKRRPGERPPESANELGPAFVRSIRANFGEAGRTCYRGVVAVGRSVRRMTSEIVEPRTSAMCFWSGANAWRKMTLPSKCVS